MMNMLNIAVPSIGLFVGSFLNLCVDGLPRRKSMNPLTMYCTSCEKPIRLYERIPVLGYVLVKGKCARCGAPLSLRYPALEITSALVMFFFFRHYGLSVEFLVNSFFVLLLVLVSLIDIRSRTVPDVLSLGGLSVGLFLAFFRRPLFFYQDALYGIFVCGGIVLIFALCCQSFLRKEILGFGDIALLAMIGAFCGHRGALFSLVAGCLLGTLIGVPLMVIRDKGARYTIPFAPCLSLGALFFISFGDRFVNAFLGFVSGKGI